MNERIKMDLGTVLDVAITSIRNGKVENALGILVDVRQQLAHMERSEGKTNEISMPLDGGMKHG